VWGSSPLRRFEVLRACLESLQTDPEDGSVAWMMVPREVVERFDAKPEDLDGLVDYPRAIEGVEVGLLFRQTSSGDTKISFRSNGPVDVNALARQFGGGGHTRASGALVLDPPHKVVPRVVEATRLAVRELRGVAG
jgi:phosphoesterase RecJ-like protein